MKFQDSNMSNYNLIKSEEDKPCMMCKDKTKYIEYCSQGRLCSIECHNKFYDIVSEGEGYVI